MADDALAPAPRYYSVLFVDDDERVLQGLERMLRPLRHEWTMQFVTSGSAALQSLDATPVDVMVTDMRMAGMSGLELLEAVRQSHPETTRIALSGNSERETVLAVAQLAHQYLSKPCDANLLKERLAQAVRLRGILRDPTLQAIVSKIVALRTMPAAYSELLAEMQRPEPSVARVGAIVASDQALTAKVLQIINSAYFGLQVHVSDPETAVRLLGLDTVRSLSLAVALSARLAGARRVSPEQLWQHGMRTARAARDVAGRMGLSQRVAQEAFTAGLLHDVGKLILAEAMNGHQAAFEQAVAEGLDRCSAERRAFGATHAQVGAYLFGLWGLSYGIVEAIAWHHAPADSGVWEASSIAAVHIANALDHAADPLPDAASEVDASYLTSIGVIDAYRRWQSAGRETP